MMMLMRKIKICLAPKLTQCAFSRMASAGYLLPDNFVVGLCTIFPEGLKMHWCNQVTNIGCVFISAIISCLKLNTIS